MIEDPSESAAISELERRLERARALPRAGFRGDLRRRLLDQARTPTPRLRFLIAAYAGSGLALLLVAGIGLAGAGPLAA